MAYLYVLSGVLSGISTWLLVRIWTCKAAGPNF